MKIKTFFIAILCFLTIIPLYSYSRVSVGGAWVNIKQQGCIAGFEQGALISKSSSPAISVEGELIILPQFVGFLKTQINPFSPNIYAKDFILPFAHDINNYQTLVGKFSLGLGWQLPLSDWTSSDFPLDVSIGLGPTCSFMYLSFSTPYLNNISTEASLGLGAFLSASFYFSPLFGISLSTMPSLSVLDYSTQNITATGGSPQEQELLTFTPLLLSWDVTLSATIRFGW